jgi:magnesium-transporting ATPase (P-type)
MLTGDKFETAENIGFSCRLLKEGMHIFRIKDDDDCEIFCSEKTLSINKALK